MLESRCAQRPMRFRYNIAQPHESNHEHLDACLTAHVPRHNPFPSAVHATEDRSDRHKHAQPLLLANLILSTKLPRLAVTKDDSAQLNASTEVRYDQKKGVETLKAQCRKSTAIIAQPIALHR